MNSDAYDQGNAVGLVTSTEEEVVFDKPNTFSTWTRYYNLFCLLFGDFLQLQKLMLGLK